MKKTDTAPSPPAPLEQAPLPAHLVTTRDQVIKAWQRLHERRSPESFDDEENQYRTLSAGDAGASATGHPPLVMLERALPATWEEAKRLLADHFPDLPADMAGRALQLHFMRYGKRSFDR